MASQPVRLQRVLKRTALDRLCRRPLSRRALARHGAAHVRHEADPRRAPHADVPGSTSAGVLLGLDTESPSPAGLGAPRARPPSSSGLMVAPPLVLRGIHASSKAVSRITRVSDVRLRGVVDGIDLAREVKMRWPLLPVILTSGHPRERGGELPPGVAYMPKPWQPLNVLIRRAIASPPSPRPRRALLVAPESTMVLSPRGCQRLTDDCRAQSGYRRTVFRLFFPEILLRRTRSFRGERSLSRFSSKISRDTRRRIY
jgi:hypothetical protein